MAAAALADALPDFGTLAATRPAQRADDPIPPRPVPDATGRTAVEKAVAEAEAALVQRLEKEFEEKLAAERRHHAEELQETVRRLGEEAGEAISRNFEEMKQEVISRTCASAARVLGAVLTEDLQSRAVDELARIVEDALAEQDSVRVRVRVSGTTFLCDALRARLGPHAASVDFSEGTGFDLTARIDESLFETRLAEWSGTLAEVLS
ncbi:hypothetical protein [Chelativorans sp. M5D2P16]|uniref:hypothetical protein n=1 Tax=Chelativorans sp. M5D2P16 TaxID=3095678 RepID=UPI002ACA5046|nr:hypothetical protein [Chelativorans sp. M5D2P16]MDZ5698452.1 hypothetical protein [Chelativorans sp. M5D2P16]